MGKSKLDKVLEYYKTGFKESYEKEFGGVATVITSLSKANTVVTFYIVVRGDYRNFEDALRFELSHSNTIQNYIRSYPKLYHKKLEEREWSKKK